MEKRAAYQQYPVWDPVVLGDRIRYVRKERGLSVEQLASAAGITPQFLFKVEKGVQSITVSKFAKLAYILGVSSDFLLFGHDHTVTRADLAAQFMGRLNMVECDILSTFIIDLQNTLDAMRPEVD